MAIANVLTVGSAAGISSDIVVNANQRVRLTLKLPASGKVTDDFIGADIVARTDTGLNMVIGRLNRQTPSVIVDGPATIAVRRDADGVFGVCSETSDAAPWSYAAAANGIVNTTTAVTIKTAAGAGLRNYITGLQISAEALGAATELAIRDGAAGTVIWRMKIGTAGIPAGLSLVFIQPIRGTANTLLEVVTLTASTTGAVYVNAQGYVDK